MSGVTGHIAIHHQSDARDTRFAEMAAALSSELQPRVGACGVGATVQLARTLSAVRRRQGIRLDFRTRAESGDRGTGEPRSSIYPS